MKTVRAFTTGLLALIIAASMISPLAAQPADEGLAKVVRLSGDARYMTAGNNTWRPLKVGTILRSGTIIQTASDSYVDVVLNNRGAVSGIGSSYSDVSSYRPKAEQDAIRIFDNTVLGVDKLTVVETGADRVTDTQLDLRAGRIFGTVKKMSAASKYEIKIPNGVAGIRGTIYMLSADGVLSVLSGSVLLVYIGADGNPVTQEVGAGQQFDARTGQLTTIATDNLIRFALDLRLPQVAPTTFTVDQTIYYVSPTTETADSDFIFFETVGLTSN